MSYTAFAKAMEMAPQCEYYTTAGGKSEAEILRAQQLLGVTFSRQCREFYEKCGYMSFFGVEIFGIEPDDDSGVLEGNSVAYALHERKNFGLPKEWIPIFNFEDGNLAFLDYAHLNQQGEPRVIMGYFNGKTYEFVNVLAEDFGIFLLTLVHVQLESQK